MTEVRAKTEEVNEANDTSAHRPIAFIIGCGRTGTHMIGHFFDGPEARVCFEKAPLERGNNATSQPHWDKIHAISRNPRVKYRYWGSIIENLKHLQDTFFKEEKLFVDKSNQLMNWVEDLLEIFPNAKFIGCTREVIPVIASMTKHNWMATDAMFADSCEVPSLFYGAMHEDFFSLGILGRFAWRWAMARQRLMYLKETYPEQMYLVHYEKFIEDADEREKLKKFLNIEANDNMGLINRNETSKSFFTEEHIGEINEAIKRYEQLHGSIQLGRGPEWNPSVRSIPAEE